MGWEPRNGTAQQYYTRTERVGQRRRRVYYGGGPLGEIAALQDALCRLEKELRRRELKGLPADPTGLVGGSNSCAARDDAGSAGSAGAVPQTPDIESPAAEPPHP